ncbi:MAG: DUF5916 domain-containing protein [Bacteroidota bacterium]
MIKNLTIPLFILLTATTLWAQNPPIESVVKIKRASDKLKVDGLLDEQSWEAADVAKDFYKAYPVDNDFATAQTEVRLTFDNQFLYVGIVCYDPTPGEYIVESLKRDWDWMGTENVGMYIDPFDDRTSGFSFSLSPHNAQREGLISEGMQINADWDNKWYSEVTNYEDKWVAEIAIPFKTLRYKSNHTNWNIQFIRSDLKNNERSSWTAVPQQYRTNNLAYAGKLIWEDPPPEPGVNISVIPYALGQASADFEEASEYELSGNAGFDAKIAVSSALNLDLTVNPDFSQVEVDEQIVNLDRFELFFPEKRQFFLENSDLFAGSGFPPSRPFFSRRIGIARDTAGNSVQVPIQFGARLSGKLNKDWRIGLMNMQTAAKKGTVLPGSENINDGFDLSGQNYTAAVLQRKLWTRSSISATFINRQATGFNAGDTTMSTSAFNRMAGLDFEFASADDKWRSAIYLHGSMDPVKKDNAFAHGAYLGYNTRHWTVNYFHNYIGEGYNAEVGYVPRKGTYSTGLFESAYIIYPKTDRIVTIKPGVQSFFTFKTGDTLSDIEMLYNLQFEFINTSTLEVGVKHNFIHLYDDFDPTHSDNGEKLPADTEYSWTGAGFMYESDSRKALNFAMAGEFGTFYNGHKLTFIVNSGYKFRPFGSVLVTAIYNDIRLPDPYASSKFWLIGPRIDVTLTNKHFLTTFIQYNEQAENMNINARFQWRFAPVSDLFIVYTDNYNPIDFSVKNRAIVLKLSYWLNI